MTSWTADSTHLGSREYGLVVAGIPAGTKIEKWLSDSGPVGGLDFPQRMALRVAGTLLLPAPFLMGAIVGGSIPQEVISRTQVNDSQSTAYDNPLARSQAAIESHYLRLFASSPEARATIGLPAAAYRLLRELAGVVCEYQMLSPGFQVTTDGSIILALGTKTTDSAMVEFFFDETTQEIENEATLVIRKNSQMKASVVPVRGVSMEIRLALA